jgi:anti-anti-sigma factor
VTDNPSVESIPGADDLQVEIQHPDATTAVVLVAGEVDPYTAVALEQSLVDASGDGVTSLVVDLAGVEFMDSSGLRVVLSAHEVMAARGVRFTLRNLSDPVRRLLEITDLLTRLDVE